MLLAMHAHRKVITPCCEDFQQKLYTHVLQREQDMFASLRRSCLMQRDNIYPHIARHDAALGINAAWLQCLTDANFKFSQWATQKAVRLNVVSPPDSHSSAASRTLP